jgi:hypothetical protein
MSYLDKEKEDPRLTTSRGSGGQESGRRYDKIIAEFFNQESDVWVPRKTNLRLG